MSPPTSVTFDFNDGDMTTTVEVARGAVGSDGHPSLSAWGVARIELTTTTPIHPDFLGAYMQAAALLILSGGVPELIDAHEGRDP